MPVAGQTTGGTSYTTGVTQSSSVTVPIGTSGSFIQIVVSDAPQLYYYVQIILVWVILYLHLQDQIL